MIYFKNDLIQFPRHSSEISRKLVITNELTDEVLELNFTDRSDDDRYYLIDLSNLTLRDGSYRYQIGSEVGLMQVGDYIGISTEYNERKQNTVYER